MATSELRLGGLYAKGDIFCMEPPIGKVLCAIGCCVLYGGELRLLLLPLPLTRIRHDVYLRLKNLALNFDLRILVGERSPSTWDSSNCLTNCPKPICFTHSCTSSTDQSGTCWDNLCGTVSPMRRKA
uniref:Uncharacterized protein n=1 Tax=Glossina pallidipes TaxID=7398 RepID=A0A1B0AIG4_GLOPL